MYVCVSDKGCSFKEDNMVDKYLYVLNMESSINKGIIIIILLLTRSGCDWGLKYKGVLAWVQLQDSNLSFSRCK